MVNLGSGVLNARAMYENYITYSTNENSYIQ